MQRLLSQAAKIITALAPDADRFNGNPASDVISLANYGHIAFIIQQAAGAVGAFKVQVEACSSNAGANNEAIPFSYRIGEADGTGLAAPVAVGAAAGYTTTAAAENKIIIIEVNADELPADKPWVRLQFTETTDGPIDAGAIAILTEGRFTGASLPDAV
jgi:hypothetical protein